MRRLPQLATRAAKQHQHCFQRRLQPSRAFTSAFTTDEVPIIDVSPMHGDRSSAEFKSLIQQVSSACSQWGFFQIIGHRVDEDMRADFNTQMRSFFDLPMDVKRAMQRDASNARGFFDNELTKQRRDWKEALDFGITPAHDWSIPDGAPANANLDGFNRFPPDAMLPSFRPAMTRYYDAFTDLSEQIATVMALGLGAESAEETISASSHTSYLRLNYYPICGQAATTPRPLGISPHSDAGFVTLLEQDIDCHSLQVRRRDSDPLDEASWCTVHPEPGALTVNTGDMAQIWSNDRFWAPEHRVLANSEKKRYSAPFFYNPAFETTVAPLKTTGEPLYDPCVWGYFRAQRFAGDFADWGSEIQISNFAKSAGENKHWHATNQSRFLERIDFGTPFSLEDSKDLLVASS